MDRHEAETLKRGDQVVVTDAIGYGATNSIKANKPVYVGLVGTIVRNLSESTVGVADASGDIAVLWDDPDCNDAGYEYGDNDGAWVYVNRKNVEPHIITFTSIEDVEAFLGA